ATGRRVRRAMDERLDERRAARPRRAAERVGIGRDRSPVDDGETGRPERVRDQPPGSTATGAGPRPRQEQLDDAWGVRGPRRVEPETRQDRRRQRERDAGAVGGGAVCAERAAVRERRQAAEGEWQDISAPPATGVRDEPDPAGVVLELRVVERGRVPAAVGSTRRLDRHRRTRIVIRRREGGTGDEAITMRFGGERSAPTPARHPESLRHRAPGRQPTAREEPDGRSVGRGSRGAGRVAGRESSRPWGYAWYATSP